MKKNDQMEIADKKNLERDIKVYAASIIELCNCNILPFDWRKTVKEFNNTLNKYQENSGKHFDLKPSIEKLNQFKELLNTFYNNIEENKIQASNANKIIMDLARILIPLNFAKNPRFTHDSAVPIPPLPTLSLCDELNEISVELIGFAQNQLVRGQNRFISTIDQAIQLIS